MGKFAFGITAHEYLGLHKEADRVRMLTAGSKLELLTIFLRELFKYDM